MITRRDASIKAALKIITHQHKYNHGKSLDCELVKRHLQDMIVIRDKQEEAALWVLKEKIKVH